MAGRTGTTPAQPTMPQPNHAPKYNLSIVSSDNQASQSSKSVRKWFRNGSPRWMRLISNWWLWELASIALSALCLCFIGLLLFFYNNQTLPRAWPLGITLNTYIAIFSAFFKYTLVVPVAAATGQLKWIWFRNQPRPLMDFERFDEATRGPWGSLLVLVRTRGRRLASLGALITLLSLGLDPFFQQIVAYPQRPDLQGASSITRSIVFKTVDPSSQINGTNVMTSDDIMWATIFDWMMGGGGQNQLSPYCPTSDCEWTPFQTLGICSTCADVSDELQFGCQNEIGDWRPGRETQPPNSTVYPPTHSCGYFFNISGEYPMLATGYATNASIPTLDSDVLLSRLLRLRTPELPDNPLPYWNGSLRFQNISWPILDFVAVSSANASATYRNETPIAHECTLQWCVKTIQAIYSGGHYSENVLTTVDQNTITGNPIVSYVDSHGTHVDFLANISITTGGETFFVDNITAFQTIMDFIYFFPTYINADNISSTPEGRYFDDPSDHAFGYGPRSIPMPSSPWLPPNDIPTYVDKMATGLTNSMRTYPNSTVLVPGSGALETFIHARWGWLVLPLVLICLAFTFLVFTIHQSSSCSGVKIWKNSALAVLLNGLTDETNRTMGPPGELSAMWERSKMVEVRLDPA